MTDHDMYALADLEERLRRLIHKARRREDNCMATFRKAKGQGITCFWCQNEIDVDSA
jgi:hypothetical protein